MMSFLVLKIGAVLLIGFLFLGWYSFRPTIKKITSPKFVQQYLGKRIITSMPVHLLPRESGRSFFRRDIIAMPGDYREHPEAEIHAGVMMEIEQFRTYKNNGSSGITSLFALGVIMYGGSNIAFEYKWDDIDLALNTPPEYQLRQAPWQTVDELTVLDKSEL